MINDDDGLDLTLAEIDVFGHCHIFDVFGHCHIFVGSASKSK